MALALLDAGAREADIAGELLHRKGLASQGSLVHLQANSTIDVNDLSMVVWNAWVHDTHLHGDLIATTATVLWQNLDISWDNVSKTNNDHITRHEVHSIDGDNLTTT